MRVLHIIPAAFNYFDDIRAEAFRLVEALGEIGVEVEALTIQYQEPSKTVTEDIEIAAPTRRYQGIIKVDEVESRLSDFDVFHIHVPLFGAVGRVLAWKKRLPGVPLFVTVYRAVRWSDFFSIFIVLYNFLFLPRLFKLADVIAASSRRVFESWFPALARRFESKFFEIDDSTKFMSEDLTADKDVVQLSGSTRLALKYSSLYAELAEPGSEPKIASEI